MGIKFGPKLEISFWSIGYLVLAGVLVVANLSWMAGSLSGIMVGRAERRVYDNDTGGDTKAYMESIDDLLKNSSLDPHKREVLQARSARLSYNLKMIDKARAEYDLLTKNADPDVAARAELSLVAIDFENAAPESAPVESRLAAVEVAMKKLDDLSIKYPSSTDVRAAQGALLMNYFTQEDPGVAVAKATEINRSLKLAGTPPGNVEGHRNALMLDLALRSFTNTATPEEEATSKAEQEEVKRVAPYIVATHKSPVVVIIDQYNQAKKDNTVGPTLLNQISTLSLQGEDFSKLVNTLLPGAIPALTTPNAKEIVKIMDNALKNAMSFSPRYLLNYDNGAGLMTRYAAIQDQTLDAMLEDMRSKGRAVPVPFGSGNAPDNKLNEIVSEEDRALNEAIAFLKSGVDNSNIENDHKAVWSGEIVDLYLWRTSLTSLNRASMLDAALHAAVTWHDLDPKNPKMMLKMAKIYELLSKPEDQKTWLDNAAAAGAKVADTGPVSNDFNFATLYPSNPLQVGTTQCVIRDQPVLVGGTFFVQGYTEPVTPQSVSISLNNTPLNVHCLDGIAYTIVGADKLGALNTMELKLALSPVLTKSANGSFRFAVK